MESATVLTVRLSDQETAEKEGTTPKVLELPAQYAGWQEPRVFRLLDYDRTVYANNDHYPDARGRSDWEEESEMIMSIPVHSACLDIAKRVMRTRTATNATDEGTAVTTMSQLWDVLAFRIQSEPLPFAIREANGYYGASQYQGLSWDENNWIDDQDRFSRVGFELFVYVQLLTICSTLKQTRYAFQS